MRILLLSNENLYSNLIIRKFIEKYNKQVIGIVESDVIIFGKNLLNSMLFILKKIILPFAAYMFFEKKIYKFKVSLGLAKLKSFRSYSRIYKIKLYKTKNINNEKTLSMVRKLKPDIIYCAGFNQKLGRSILNIPKLGCINLHPALLPFYRGPFPYFWILANNEKESGVSAHFIDEKWDTGELIMQKRFGIMKNTMQHLCFKSALLAGEMLLEIQDLLEKKAVKSFPQKRGGSYYPWPNKKGYQNFKMNRKKFFKFKELWNSI
jgi:folate-dependent phosphoribosylglycinamide formyltransferase PurN